MPRPDENGWLYAPKCRNSEFIMWESGGGLSRKQVTLAAGQEYAPGTVMGMLSTGGKHVPYDNTASDGRQMAVGILVHGVDARASDRPGILLNYHARVRTDLLTGLDTAARADLLALQIKMVDPT